MNQKAKTRYVLMRYDWPEAIFVKEDEADRTADILNDAHDSMPYHVVEVYPSDEVIAAAARVRKVWRSTRTGLTVMNVADMSINHLTNAAHLCLTWKERFPGIPMDAERRAMCQNVRDEIVRRKINEVGK